jgi:hypothetical protein
MIPKHVTAQWIEEQKSPISVAEFCDRHDLECGEYGDGILLRDGKDTERPSAERYDAMLDAEPSEDLADGGPFARAVSLHLTRAFRAARMASREAVAIAMGERRITLDTQLTNAAGGDEVVERTIATLGRSDVVTIGDLVTAWKETPKWLAKIDGVGERGLLSIAIEALKNAADGNPSK